MEVYVAENAGFCFGVIRALSLAQNTAKTSTGPIFTLGPLIHNPQVVKQLAEEGIKEIGEVEHLLPGSTLIIPSHGVGPEVLSKINHHQVKIVDTTCPFVKRAQKLAHDLVTSGLQVIVVGDQEHPEVKGIVGYTNGQAVVVKEPEEARSLSFMPEVAVLAQTTQSLVNFQAVQDVLRQKTDRLHVYNTICHATSLRQQSTIELARKVEVMVVVGGVNSANTRRLAELSRESQTPTYQVESAQELNPAWFSGVKVAGLTAGASTPNWILEEVQKRMKELGELTMEEKNEISGMEEEVRDRGTPSEPEMVTTWRTDEAVVPESVRIEDEKTGGNKGDVPSPIKQAPDITPDEGMREDVEVRSLRPGQIVTGVVVQIGQDEVLVDVGAKSEGVIPLRELSVYPVSSPQDVVSIGQEIEVAILKVEDDEGRLVLSKARADAEKAWVQLQEHMENGQPVEGIVREVVKGGLLVDVGVRAFLPASLVERGYVEDLNKYLGMPVKAKVIELNRGRKKAILSRKAFLEEEMARQRQAVLAELEEGEVIKGTVRRLTSFGAFVDIGGIDGLLHISEIAWYRINHPADVLSVGDEIEVMVLRVNRENEKISLGLKQVLPNPWDTVAQKYRVGSVVRATVVRLASFGAFVELEPGVEGLVHISHLADYHVATPDEVVQEGNEVDVKVLSVDPDNKRIRLSIREANREQQEKGSKPKQQNKQQKSNNGNITIGDVVGDIFEER